MNKLKAVKLRSIVTDFKNDSITADGSIPRCDICDILTAVDDKHKKTRLKMT